MHSLKIKKTDSSLLGGKANAIGPVLANVLSKCNTFIFKIKPAKILFTAKPWRLRHKEPSKRQENDIASHPRRPESSVKPVWEISISPIGKCFRLVTNKKGAWIIFRLLFADPPTSFTRTKHSHEHSCTHPEGFLQIGFLLRLEILLFSKASSQFLGHNSYSAGTGGTFPGINKDRSCIWPLTSSEIKNERNYTFTPPYAFLVCTGIYLSFTQTTFRQSLH
jgi:hypothetical protein